MLSLHDALPMWRVSSRLDMLWLIKQQRHAKAIDGDMRRAVDLRPMVADEDEDGIVEPRLAAGAVYEIAKGPVGIRGRIRLALLLGILVDAPLRIGIEIGREHV